jgi:hypothetical protein
MTECIRCQFLPRCVCPKAPEPKSQAGAERHAHDHSTLVMRTYRGGDPLEGARLKKGFEMLQASEED